MREVDIYEDWLRRRELFQAALHSSRLSPEEAQELTDELARIERIIAEMERRQRGDS
jgi:hypothetical protein